jgi:hypothetical protein
MRALVTGAGGFLGSAVVGALRAAGHQVLRLVRREPVSGDDEIFWDPAAGRLDPRLLEGLQAVVHLAGENIAAGRWTPARKARIRASRIDATRLLCEALAGTAAPPTVLLCASAVGIYGDRGAELLTEESPPGTGFLAELCRDWEGATSRAADCGIRVVHLRFGLVLSPAGGALGRMLPLFRLGLGGVIGGGEQFMSWISLPDALNVIEYGLATNTWAGPVNVVAPTPVSHREFVQTLARALRRPALAPLPAFAVRLLLGKMGRETLLSSARVRPVKLEQSGFPFAHGDLSGALRSLLAG